jgi:hypothetical protein
MISVEPQRAKGRSRKIIKMRVLTVTPRQVVEYQEYLKRLYGHYIFMAKLWNKAAQREESGMSKPWSRHVYGHPAFNLSRKWRKGYEHE